MKKKILCIGDVIVDCIPSAFPLENKNIILNDGETFVNSVTFQRGGCGGNFVCVLKTIFPDADVHFISRIGNDSNADFLIQEMNKYEVIPKFIRDSSVSTQITLAVSYLDGERHFITYLGGLANFCKEDISESDFDQVDHLAFRGPWFAEKLLKNCGEILKIAYDKNIPISLDLGFDPFWNRSNEGKNIQQIIQDRKNSILKALQYVTYLFGNENEFVNLTNTESVEEAIPLLLEYGVKNIIMHRGSKGARIITRSVPNSCDPFLTVDIPAAKVQVINPVGSGDTFDSILIAQLLDGKEISCAAAIASAGAAFSLQSKPGTKITIENVMDFIKSIPILNEFL